MLKNKLKWKPLIKNIKRVNFHRTGRILWSGSLLYVNIINR